MRNKVEPSSTIGALKNAPFCTIELAVGAVDGNVNCASVWAAKSGAGAIAKNAAMTAVHRRRTFALPPIDALAAVRAVFKNFRDFRHRNVRYRPSMLAR
jgi:hypothetical protein